MCVCVVLLLGLGGQRKNEAGVHSHFSDSWNDQIIVPLSVLFK